MTLFSAPEVVAAVPAALIPEALSIRSKFENGAHLMVPRPGAPMEAAGALARAGFLEPHPTEPSAYVLATSREVFL